MVFSYLLDTKHFKIYKNTHQCIPFLAVVSEFCNVCSLMVRLSFLVDSFCGSAFVGLPIPIPTPGRLMAGTRSRRRTACTASTASRPGSLQQYVKQLPCPWGRIQCLDLSL